MQANTVDYEIDAELKAMLAKIANEKNEVHRSPPPRPLHAAAAAPSCTVRCACVHLLCELAGAAFPPRARGAG